MSKIKDKFFSVHQIKLKMEQYCIYQDRSHKDVEKKLSEYTIIPEAKEQIILHLLQENFLNEERFAQNFTLGKFKNNKWGRNKIKHQLQAKGISTYNIQNALQQINEEEYCQILKNIAIKKATLTNEKNKYKKKAKIMQYLYAKGFELDLVKEVVTKIIEK